VKEALDDGQGPTRKPGAYSPSVQPFLKWPGGKRWLVPELIKIINEYEYVTYREPFLGGGRCFLLFGQSTQCYRTSTQT